MLYVNCYNRTRYLAAISIKIQKENNFWQFKDHSWRKPHANCTSDPIFFVYFSSSKCLWNYFLYMKVANIHFHLVPLKFILVGKIPQFWTKTKDALRILKIHIMFCSPNGAEKIYQLMALFKVCVNVTRSFWFKHRVSYHLMTGSAMEDSVYNSRKWIVIY